MSTQTPPTLTENNILPCPYCGLTPEIEDWSDHHGEYWHLKCSNPGCPVVPYTEGTNKQALIAAWNIPQQEKAVSESLITSLSSENRRLKEGLESAKCDNMALRNERDELTEEVITLRRQLLQIKDESHLEIDRLREERDLNQEHYHNAMEELREKRNTCNQLRMKVAKMNDLEIEQKANQHIINHLRLEVERLNQENERFTPKFES